MLVVCGPAFLASEIYSFVTATMSAHLVFVSPYYPQRNAINGACHQSIERGLKTAVIDLFHD